MVDSALQAAFGEVLRDLRQRARLSQEELSFRCGRHRTYVSLIERGKNSPSITTLWLLAAALDVLPSALLRSVEALLGKGESQASGPPRLEAVAFSSKNAGSTRRR